MTSKEALKELTWLLHDEFDENPKHSRLNVSQRLGMFKKVKDTLEHAQQKEKLLELYRKLITVKNEIISLLIRNEEYDEKEVIEIDLEKQIKELENEI